MKLPKSKKGEDLSLSEVIQLVCFAIFLVGFIAFGVMIYKSLWGNNPNSLAIGQFDRLIHDVTVRSIPKSPFITDEKAEFFIQLKNRYMDETQKKPFLEICLHRKEKDITLKCENIIGNKTDSEDIIPFSGSFDIKIGFPNENTIHLSRIDEKITP